MKKHLRVPALVLAIAIVAIGCQRGDEGAEAAAPEVDYTDNAYTDGADLSGTTVNIFGAFVDVDAERFEKSMIPFEEATGIDIVYEGSGDFETLIRVRADGGDPPDIAAFPQPGIVADLVAGGNVLDIADWFGMEYLRQQYNDAWIDLAQIGGIQTGVWYRASVKSLVWYNLPVF